MMKTPAIHIDKLGTRLGGRWVHRDLNLDVMPHEILVLAGGSGSGKTVLLREMILLQRPTCGDITVLGYTLANLSRAQQQILRHHWGVLFQQNALFSSLTILQNVLFPLRRFSLDKAICHELALLKLKLAGLSTDVASRYPAELSGGMQKRAALARALMLDPAIVFLDEPTAGLDPGLVASFDQLILDLRAALGLTIVMVTHDVESMRRTADRIAFLGEGKVLCVDTPDKVRQNSHPLIEEFFANGN
jgi:phospholipid/cholesterol/gamma-HCH transport system ATP-binding protein